MEMKKKIIRKLLKILSIVILYGTDSTYLYVYCQGEMKNAILPTFFLLIFAWSRIIFLLPSPLYFSLCRYCPNFFFNFSFQFFISIFISIFLIIFTTFLLLYSLDFLQENIELRKWYGKSYKFLCNPLSLPFSISDTNVINLLSIQKLKKNLSLSPIEFFKNLKMSKEDFILEFRTNISNLYADIR